CLRQAQVGKVFHVIARRALGVAQRLVDVLFANLVVHVPECCAHLRAVQELLLAQRASFLCPLALDGLAVRTIDLFYHFINKLSVGRVFLAVFAARNRRGHGLARQREVYLGARRARKQGKSNSYDETSGMHSKSLRGNLRKPTIYTALMPPQAPCRAFPGNNA